MIQQSHFPSTIVAIRHYAAYSYVYAGRLNFRPFRYPISV